MQENVVSNLYSTYRKLDSRTERLITALQSSTLDFNLGKGVNYSVMENPENKQGFSVTFTLSYQDKLYDIGSMYVNNFDAQNETQNITFSNHFIQQMVEHQKSFDDSTIAINDDSAQEQALHFLQKHRKVSSQITASFPGKDVINEFLKNILTTQHTEALNDCLAKYPQQSTWPFYALSGSALVFLAMCVTGSVFMGLLKDTVGMFILADFGGVVGGFGTLACLVWIGCLAYSAFNYNSVKDSVIQTLTQINSEKSDLSPEAKKILESSVDQEKLLVEGEEQDAFHHSPVPTCRQQAIQKTNVADHQPPLITVTLDS